MTIVWPQAITGRHPWLRSIGRLSSQGMALKVSYVLLQMVDLFLTLLAQHLGYWEVNPWMRSLLASPAQLVTVKLVIPLLLAWLVPGKLLIPAVVFLALVTAWNVKELIFIFL